MTGTIVLYYKPMTMWNHITLSPLSNVAKSMLERPVPLSTPLQEASHLTTTD